PQGDGSTGPALTGGEEGGERDLIVLDASDVLHDAFAVRRPGIDAEGEVSSKRLGHLRPGLSSVSTIRQASIVTNITTSGFRTVWVGKRNSARNAAGNRAAALGWIGLRGIGSSSAVAAIGLCIRRLRPNGRGQNAHDCDSGQSALHDYRPRKI